MSICDRLLTQLTEMGAIICPPAPAFYHRPKSLEDLVDHTLARLLDLLGIDVEPHLVPRWQGPKGQGAAKTRETGA